MLSAFGVDHGEISKGKGPASAMKWWHGVKPGRIALANDGRVGAGGDLTARKLAGSRVPNARESADSQFSANYAANKKQAHQQGKLAARHIASGAGADSYGAQYAANTGWQKKAAAVTSINRAPKAAPVGNRGPIQGRVQTKKMKAFNESFM